MVLAGTATERGLCLRVSCAILRILSVELGAGAAWRDTCRCVAQKRSGAWAPQAVFAFGGLPHCKRDGGVRLLRIFLVPLQGQKAVWCVRMADLSMPRRTSGVEDMGGHLPQSLRRQSYATAVGIRSLSSSIPSK